MLLYQDLIGPSQDEMFNDAFPVKLVDDFLYEVECAMIVVKDGEVDIGANPSAEEQEEALENGAESVNDVIHSMRLQPTPFDEKSYKAHLRGYLKAVKAQLSEEYKPVFQKKANDFAMTVLKNIKDYDFYTGSSRDVDGMVVLLNFREDGITPYLIFWKDGLKESKL